MDFTSRSIVIGCSGFLLLLGASTGEAGAEYLGYADGAPGPADIWAASHPSFGRVTHRYHSDHKMWPKHIH